MRGRYASKLRWVLVLASVLLWTNEPASAQPAVQRGYIFVRVHCSQCHAIGRSGASPHSQRRHRSEHCGFDIPSPTCSDRYLRESIPRCLDFSLRLAKYSM